MKKKFQSKFALALAILFTIFSLPMNGMAASAEENLDPNDLQDGTYEIDYKVDNKDVDVDEYFEKPALLTVEKDEIKVQIKHTSTNFIKKILVPSSNVNIIEENKDDKSRIIEFELDKGLSEPVDMKTSMVYGMDHPVELNFNTNSLKIVKLSPVKEVKTETIKEDIDFETIKEDDDSLEKGKTKVKQEGQKGSKEVEYEVTYTDGKETNREPTGEENIIKEPVNKIILKGTKNSKPEAPNKGESSKKPSKPTKEDLIDGIYLKDGVYELNYTVDHDGDDFSKHFIQPATLTVKNDKTQLKFKHKDIGFINEIALPNGQVNIVNEDQEEQTRVVSFDIKNNLSETVNMSLKMVYGMTHPVNLNFDLDFVKDDNKEKSKTEIKTETEKIKFETVKKKDDSLEKGKTKVKQKGQKGSKEIEYKVTYKNGEEIDREPTGEEKIIKEPVDKIVLVGTKGKEEKLKDGTYNITAKAMHETKEEPSAAAQFINEEAKLIVKNNNVKLQITVPESDMASIDGIQVEKKEAKINKKGKETKYTFNLDEIKTELDSKVQYSVPSLNMEHDVPFRFILEDIPSDLYDVEESDEFNPNPRLSNDGSIDKEVPKKEDLITPDKVSEINYTIKEENGIKDSIANDFFTNKGILLEKGDKMYVQMTITEGDMVKSLKNKYGEALLVEEKNDGSIVVQLEVDKDLSNSLLNMHIVVPEMPGFTGYNKEHNALLVFDKGSKKEIDIGDYKIVSSDINGGLGKGGTNPDEDPKSTPDNGVTKDIVDNLKNSDIDKPEFGSNGDNADSNKDKANNPQTGDLTNIWLYAFLLAGSLLVLGFKFRRRTI